MVGRACKTIIPIFLGSAKLCLQQQNLVPVGSQEVQRFADVSIGEQFPDPILELLYFRRIGGRSIFGRGGLRPDQAVDAFGYGAQVVAAVDFEKGEAGQGAFQFREELHPGFQVAQTLQQLLFARRNFGRLNRHGCTGLQRT